ncbi:tRNA adenosine(34) deaminase TadA [Clostridium sp. 'deep sea']|nr:tRNA adenosine(34) deaminase TadA [Clostridium sp. 'deep sea']
MKYHEKYMREALIEAQKAADIGEVPVGAIAVYNDKIIARGHNLRETKADPTAHAEMIVIRKAAAFIKGWRLTDITLYVTLEPCIMCAGAVVQSRLGKLVYGAKDPKAGVVGSIADVIRTPHLPNNTEVLSGILATECSDLLKIFFSNKRND